MKDSKDIKLTLLQRCYSWIDQRIANAEEAMNASQEAANTEEKSSAGDKYETGRAMAQLERDKAAQQLHEAIMLKSALIKLSTKTSVNRVVHGSLVITDKNNFFLAISAGKLHVGHADYYVIGPNTPMGKVLMGASVGNRFSFNNQVHTIREIL